MHKKLIGTKSSGSFWNPLDTHSIQYATLVLIFYLNVNIFTYNLSQLPWYFLQHSSWLPIFF